MVNTRIIVPRAGQLSAQQPSLPAPTHTVVPGGGGDFTAIQDALEDISGGGNIIEVRADTPFGAHTFVESLVWDVNTADGTDGNENILRCRIGDTISLEGAILNGARMKGTDVSFWRIGGFSRLGTDSWAGGVPYETANHYEARYGIWFGTESHHIVFENMGREGDETIIYKMWGANNFTANQSGNFGKDGGAHHHLWLKCHFGTHGNNNNVGGSSSDFGDIIRIATPNSMIVDCTGLQAGHNIFSIEEGTGVVRGCVLDNSWIARMTGEDGYRPAELSGNKKEISPSNILSEHNVFRNALSGANNANPPNVKYQGRRLIARYDSLITGDGHSILANVDQGIGDDGDVTESKFYHLTISGTDSVFRQVTQAGGQQDGFTDSYFEQTFKNLLIQNLGTGDNLRTNSYIYKDDESDRGIYSIGWKGDLWDSITIDTTAITFEISLDDNTGGFTHKSIADALADWPSNFSNIDEEAVTFSNLANAKISWDIDQIHLDLAVTVGPKTIGGASALTTMVGVGSNATTGTIADARFFAMLDTDFDLSYFGEQNDLIEINGQQVRLVTLNKNTGVATWDNAISWSNGDAVNHVDEIVLGAVHANRGAIG